MHYWGGENKIEFHVNGKECLIKIEFEKILPVEVTKLPKKVGLRCTATMVKVVDKKVENLLMQIGSEISEPTRKIINEISAELSNIIILTTTNYRWKMGIVSSYNPIASRNNLSWSIDGKKWKSLPHDVRLNIEFGLPIKKRILSNDIILLQQLVENRIHEPLGYELFYEAWELKKSNPRSSLIIGIAAIEAAFKECVSILIPDASWLINNVPSPPLIKMLNKFLPLLPCKQKIRGKIIPPPKAIMKILNDGVENRNLIAHGRSSQVDIKFLEEFLRAVRDLLYLLDYYSGHEWAWNNISSETTISLVDDAEKKR